MRVLHSGTPGTCPQLLFIEVRLLPGRIAEADPHGPVLSGKGGRCPCCVGRAGFLDASSGGLR